MSLYANQDLSGLAVNGNINNHEVGIRFIINLNDEII